PITSPLRGRPTSHAAGVGARGEARATGGQPRVPRPAQPVLAVLVVALHPAPAPGRGRPGRDGMVQGGAVPRPEHLGVLPALPVAATGDGLARRRPRRRADPRHEPRRWSRDVGQDRRWLSQAAGPRSTRRGPEAGAVGGRSSPRLTRPG